jgi:hypothetical protein
VASDLASPQYVIVGSVWAVLVTGMGLPLFFAVNLTRASFPEKSFAKAIELLAAWILSILWWILLMMFFNIIDPRKPKSAQAFSAVLGMFIEIIILRATITVLYNSRKDYWLFGSTPFAELNFEQRMKIFRDFIGHSVSLLALLLFYSLYVFPVVPRGSEAVKSQWCWFCSQSQIKRIGSH